MKRSTLLALIATGIGLAGAGTVATTAVRAATTTASGSATTTTTTNDASPPGMPHDQQNLSDMASILGISTTQLQTELQGGKQFYQIAAEHGVSYDKLKASAEAAYKTKLDDMVKVGYLTQTEANTFLQQWQTQAATSPMVGFNGPGHEHMGM